MEKALSYDTIIFTAGYQSFRKPQRLLEVANDNEAMLVDIRYNPTSKVGEWRKESLEELFGDNYLSVRDLGNANYYKDAGGIRIWNFDRGLARIEPLLRYTNLILLCACWDLETCHRLLVSQRIAGELPGTSLVHLHWTKEGLKSA